MAAQQALYARSMRTPWRSPTSKGNRQLLSAGNVAVARHDRADLFLMDYPPRTWLKVMGRVQVLGAHDERVLAAQVVEGCMPTWSPTPFSCDNPDTVFQTPLVRPARLATIVSSSAGSTGLDTCI